eukprot:gene15378-21463_t
MPELSLSAVLAASTLLQTKVPPLRSTSETGGFGGMLSAKCPWGLRLVKRLSWVGLQNLLSFRKQVAKPLLPDRPVECPPNSISSMDSVASPQDCEEDSSTGRVSSDGGTDNCSVINPERRLNGPGRGLYEERDAANSWVVGPERACRNLYASGKPLIKSTSMCAGLSLLDVSRRPASYVHHEDRTNPRQHHHVIQRQVKKHLTISSSCENNLVPAPSPFSSTTMNHLSGNLPRLGGFQTVRPSGVADTLKGSPRYAPRYNVGPRLRESRSYQLMMSGKLPTTSYPQQEEPRFSSGMLSGVGSQRSSDLSVSPSSGGR